MTPWALASHPAVVTPRKRLRGLPLAAKLGFAFVGLVAFALAVNGAIEAWLGYQSARRAALDLEAEKARAAAERVEGFLSEIETQIGWTTGAEWRFGKPEQQRYDFIRVLRVAPAITALAFLDGQGREQLAVSRLDPDSLASGKDFSHDPRFVRAVADKAWFGPVEFRRGSEPYMTVAVAHVGKNSGVTVADVNLKLIWDVISSIRVGQQGYAYVVDSGGRLIADPDLSLVLRDTDLSALPQVRAALAHLSAGEQDAGPAEVAAGRDGAQVLTAYAVAPKPRWVVFVQQPLSEAFAPVAQALWRTGALLGIGLSLAFVSGAALARRMTAPIRALQAGAERLGAGDLAQRIDVRTGDEIEALAGGFNAMAGRLQESYETLEARVEARTRDLNEALAQQTATADVLKIISRSVEDAAPVFQTILDSCQRLFDPYGAAIYLVEGETVRGVARRGFEGSGHWGADSQPLAGSSTGQAMTERRAVQYLDLADKADLPEPSKLVLRETGGMTVLYAPMLSGERGVGSLVLTRRPKKPFSDAEIDFIQTFADQAVIAIENARLFEEVQARTREVEEALAQQTATADVLKVISRSAFDLDASFDALLKSAIALTGAWSGALFFKRGDSYEARGGGQPTPPEFQRRLTELGNRISSETLIGRVLLTGAPVNIADVEDDPEYDAELKRLSGLRAVMGVPLRRGDEVIGGFSLSRREPGPFAPRQIELMKTFADQAVIALENSRLFDEVQARTRELEHSLADLRKAQDRLVQSEKLASLGQLTAGIAHEIKNPLNFVNNFAALSRELLDELRASMQALPECARADADEIIGMIDSNLEKVASHGKRADSIVKNMLLHSREGSGERTTVNVNAMVEEALNLGYHGARAEKPGFNVTLEKSFDPEAGEADIYLQEITRVLLNLISNGFYASDKRRQVEGPDFAPTLRATTRGLGHSVEIRIRDNGTGIPEDVRAKMFNPFFTTKPAGEGTGLGLSLSHDIIVKQHGGAIDVETEPGAFTEFVIALPREGAKA